uniref:C2H2-type domain-containing protein n=1 Tax=Wuchereria bancrofti TaxID=6293 RepID=A0AAF5PUG4_WUCBA
MLSLSHQQLEVLRRYRAALHCRQLYIYSLFHRLLATTKLLMANSNQQQHASAFASDNNTTSKVDNQPQSSNTSNNLFNQSMIDLASLLEIPLFNELMLVYEIQYNATKDALKHFLEEQPSLILPLFTNVLWSLLVNPLLAISPVANLNSSAQDLPISAEDLQKIVEEMLDKTKTPDNSMQNVPNPQQCNQRTPNQLNNNTDKRTRSANRAENKNSSILCNVCAKPLKNRAAFVKHRRRHLGISELAFACGTCDKRCSERRHLAVHCKNKHHEMPSLRNNAEKKDMIILNNSKEESPDSIPEIKSVNEKVLVKLWQSDDDKNSISNGTHTFNQS